MWLSLTAPIVKALLIAVRSVRLYIGTTNTRRNAKRCKKNLLALMNPTNNSRPLSKR